MGYLSETGKAAVFDLPAAVQHLATSGGPGGLRQAFDLLRLRYGRSTVKFEEYYTYALWRKDRGEAFLKEFLTNNRLGEFNSAFNMPARGLATDVLNDKLQTAALLAARGIPVTRTLALYMPTPDPLTTAPAGPRRLGTAGDVAAFLSDPANLPVFGKPRADRYARGAVVIEGLDGPDRVRFLNSKTAPIPALADEIAADWTQGYLFQPFYQCETGLRRHVGAAMASVRIVTLQTDRGIEPWYAVIRLPAKTAMHDGDAFDMRIWGLIDPETGKITRLRNLRDPLTPDLTHGNDPDTPFLGSVLPHWDSALQICLVGHESFPGHGIIGWDIFLTDEGALMNEANASPGHVYQVAAQRPLLNADLRPAYDRAMAFARKYGGGRSIF